MAVAFTCPVCGHRNLIEAVPIELSEGDVAAAREQGVEIGDRTGWIGSPDDAECSKCGETIDLTNYEGHYFKGQWIEDDD